MKTLGFDLGGHNIAAALVEFDGGRPEIRLKKIVPTPESRDPESVIRALVNLTAELSGGQEIEAVGIGLPGFIDKSRRRIERLTNFAGFENIEFVPLMERRLAEEGIRTKVLIENDANCFALGEGIRGAAVGCRDYVVLTLGTGIGAGIVVEGRLLLGAHGQAGEAGHITDRGDLACNCGGFSHAETVAAADGVEREARARGLTPDFKTLWGNRKEAKVSEVLEPALETLARCIASVSVVTDPELVILGGGMSRAEGLTAEITPRVLRYLPASFKPNLKIEISQLGEEAVFYGAAALFTG